MTHSNLLIKSICLFFFTITLAACSAPQVSTKHFYWPQLPERPRVEWVKSYKSQLDFPKSDYERSLTKLIGENIAVAFDRPLFIASDSKGKVYVTNSGKIAGVYVYDFNESTVHLIGKDNAAGLFSSPSGVAVDNDGNVYVADVDKNAILIFDKAGAPKSFLSTQNDVKRPVGIAVDNDRNRLLVTDSSGHRIVVYDLAGKHQFSIGKLGSDDGEFNLPVSVAVNHKGEIIVADSMNARVQIFNADGTFLRKYGKRGDGAGDFQLPKGVAVDSDDNIYVTDGRGNKVVIHSSTGVYLLTFGGTYSAYLRDIEAPGGFLLPYGIYIDKNDAIYVVDQFNYRFQVLQYISDKYLDSHPIDGYNKPAPVK